MIFQLIDDADESLRMWTGTAASALLWQDEFERRGRPTSVADYKGRHLTATALYECMERENERHAMASLALFRQAYEPGED